MCDHFYSVLCAAGCIKKQGKTNVAEHLCCDIIQLSEFSHCSLLVFSSYLTQKQQSDCLLGWRGFF